MRVALDFVPVHVGAGVAFIRVADDVLLRRHRLAQKIPFLAGGKPGAAAPAQFGGFDLLDDHVGPVVDEHVVKRLIAAHGDVLFHIVGIDQPAVAQNDLLLAFEKGDVAPGRNVGVAGSVLDLRGDMVPILNLAEGQVRGDLPHHHVINDLVDLLALHPVENHQGPAGEPDIHQRLLGAETEAAHAGQKDIQAALVDGIGKGVKTPSAPLPAPQVPIPTAMRGRKGSSLAIPAPRTVLNVLKSRMRVISLPSPFPSASARVAASARSCGRTLHDSPRPPEQARIGQSMPPFESCTCHHWY
jgi:hypothetical protein